MWFIPFSFRDFIDIIAMALIMYWIYRSSRGTNAPYILTGIVTIYVLWVVVKSLNMELLSSVLGQIISVGVIAMLIVFQPEIRRFLLMIGMRQKEFDFITKIFGSAYNNHDSKISPIVEAVAALSKSRRGATFVLARMSDLSLITDGGLAVDAMMTEQLLLSLYGENSPLGDGAVVIASNRVVAANCILPITQSELSLNYEMRHRAAIGLSEISDAIVVVVSEYSGKVAIARAGHLSDGLTIKELARDLKRYVGAVDSKELSLENEVAQ
ncbi:MAG: diadenylate cyclase [Rikenellaceae bacterium]